MIGTVPGPYGTVRCGTVRCCCCTAASRGHADTQTDADADADTGATDVLAILNRVQYGTVKLSYTAVYIYSTLSPYFFAPHACRLIG